MKKLLLTFLFSFLLSTATSYAASPDDYDQLAQCKPALKSHLISKEVYPRTDIIMYVYRISENKAAHDYFDWRWDLHYLVSYHNPDTNEIIGWSFSREEYQDFVSPDSRGYIEYTVFDYDKDGIPDGYHKSYTLVMQDNTIMMPEWPEGYVDSEWGKMTQEEMQIILDEELWFWRGVCRETE